MNQSLFHFYSIGIVATNKVMSSDEIMVTPLEVLNMLDGDITSNPTKQTIQGTDASGRSYTVSAIHDNCLVATWYNIAGNNQVTSPDVRRGERVNIYRYGDADKFYWTPFGMDNHLRKLETVRHAYSGTTDETDTTLTPDNSWYHEVSTHQKTATFSTSKKNGEVAGYTVQIDAANGLVHIQDDQGQVFELDTQNNRMSMTNAQGSQIRVDKENISITCKDTLAISATNQIKIDTKDIVVNCETMEITASKTIAMKAATSFSCDTPEATFTGNVTMKSFIVQGGGGTSQGSITLNGTLTANEGISSPTQPIHGPTQTLN